MAVAIVFLLAYLLPAFIAILARKRNWLAITILNIFFGISIIGWVVALVWSLTKDSK